MRKTFLLLLGICCNLWLQAQEATAVYLNNKAPMEERIEDALSRMTLEEKIAMIHAQSKFSSPGVPRLGIPEVWMTDGPHGIRPEVLWDEWDQAGWTNDSCIAFPSLTCLASSWDKNMAYLYGKSIGEEARYRNKTVLLGPGVNIYRSPLNGRNFEYMGEDPYLSSQMVVPYVQGVQENGVAACVKHFALNNQETDRHGVNVVVDDRALYEIYLPAFKAAVQEGHAWAIMGAYGLYKHQQCCHNQYLLQDILRNEWKFDGVVVSDWGGVHQTEQAIYNGLDMEFGSWTDGLTMGKTNAYDAYYLADPYYKMIKSGAVGTKELDTKVRNILRLIFRTEMYTERPFGSFGTKAHADTGRKIAEGGIVLLKNDKETLPIDLTKTKNILVVGENAIKMMTVGGGSSSLKAKYEVSPLEGLKNKVGDVATITYARGYIGDASGDYNGVKSGQDLSDDRTPEELLLEAIKEAKKADMVIFVGGLNKSDHQDSEGADRLTMDLPYGQDKIVTELLKVNKNLVFINISGNAVTMPWADEVPAIVQGWYLGTETGNALAAILTGEVNPSGKLCFTFPKKLADNSAHTIGEFGKEGEVRYTESIFVGYRHHDNADIAPLFAFGHGLSYTSFEYGKVIASNKEMNFDGNITITTTVTNTGDRAGAEVVQMYITDVKSSLVRPEKELKGFEKIFLEPGETKTVKFVITKDALSYFDDAKHAWIAEPGKFKVLIGSSSLEIEGSEKFELIN
ncbi:glycoside hydrolase family 3 C-terminal domain-containing protein [Neptunitalea lumnitzerae]|uniref:Glycosyl hydrolase n=1 Tax=Neptunitalea lumnitzerae TaxID=2965509 RepID=A0ABQ5MJ15_9FLAO|nr:glycoside hydrolase family 3 C-terminal domain-containing protein [Neptunitalea sp. Y10]GLB49403.1 glycosyl hydrolase [Neptunitalea sp. Y10]